MQSFRLGRHIHRPILSLALGSAFLLACSDTGVPDQAGTPRAGTGSSAAGSAGIGNGGSGAGGTAGTTSGSAGTGGAVAAGGSSGGTAAGRGGSGGNGGSSGQSAGGSGGSTGGLAGGGTGGGTGGTASGSSGTGGTGGEGGAVEPPALDAFELVVIGSSTAAGEGASSDDRGWVSLLAEALEQTSSADITTVNLARGGYTTSELASGSNDDGNIDDAIDRDPNLIVVSLAGSNDLSAGTSESEFISRLSELRELANEAEIPVFFLSTAPKDLGTSEREALRDWSEAMADEFGSCWAPGVTGDYSPCFVDIFEPLANDNLGIDDQYGSGDGIHLNDEGHERIFEVTEPVISAYGCSLTACP